VVIIIYISFSVFNPTGIQNFKVLILKNVTLPAKNQFSLPPNVTIRRTTTLPLPLSHPNQKVLSLSLSNQLFGFISGSFGNATLRFLDSLLLSKDVKSLVEIRSSLTQLLKSESLSIIQSIAAESVHDKLLVLEFFVRAFALVGDLEVLYF
jgi:hypothetical protein